MAELATIARPYAEALFRVALPSRLNAWADVLSQLAQVTAVPEFRALNGDPRVSRAAIRDTILAALKGNIDDEVKNFVATLTDNGRLMLAAEIDEQFRALKNAHESTADAEIVSAFPMSDAQLADLVTALQKKFGRTLVPHLSVDQSLIGGVRVTVGDEVLDSSVKARLQHMQTVLAA